MRNPKSSQTWLIAKPNPGLSLSAKPWKAKCYLSSLLLETAPSELFPPVKLILGRNKNMPKLKKIPHFKTEKQERTWWQKHDSTKYVSYKSLQHWSFPNLKLSTKPITLRLPQGVINRLKIRANKADIPYQSLIKQSIFDFLSK